MLKITKGLKPSLHKDITSYIDDRGNDYVRVRVDDEDFCIAARDYIKGDEKKFIWNDAMELSKQEGMKLPTMKQISILKSRLGDINDVIGEIGGDKLKDDNDWYWTATEYDDDAAQSYNSHGNTVLDYKVDHLRVRMVLNL